MKYNKMRIELGALATGMFYNAQAERIKAFNRIRQVIYRRLEGIELCDKQDKKEKGEKYIEEYTDAKLLKYILENKAKLDTEEQEYVDSIMELLQAAREKENKFKTLMTSYVEHEPLFEWLNSIRGIATLNSANLLQYFGYCEKAKHCSSLWKYAGLHVVDGKAPKKSKGEGQLDWNPHLRTLMYRIGDCFVKHRTPKYREIYDTEKARQLELGAWDEKKKKMINKDKPGCPQSLGHADNRARRKMIKHFLVDYYVNCLKIRGITPDKVYAHRND